ncbi:beta-Ala-His dipeptidase isoform X4 [Malaclemys terrapin pileata]|uniref:beta-Ala-His dipeptidase isoform X4 n=1 Tax=Malaclemys terrapin pileata TaxID=2991368 RepID=UPI0023A8DA96|nr:beta-Ala-His dipeptidase isoform X4 [Malaclemys terrapin pileata]
MYLTNACGCFLFNIANFVLNLQILALSVIMLLFEAGVSSSSSGLENQIFQYIDLHQNEFIQTLKEWVAVESDSIQPGLRQEVIRMVELTADRLRALGATVELVKLGSHKDIPVNLKFIIEGMEEAGSLGLEEIIKKENQRFFSDVDFIVISDNLWLNNRKPALTYGTRGNICFSVEVRCGERDLHSGSFGGIIHEPMTDLIALLDSLVDTSGRILIPGVYDDVASLSEEEKKLYEAIEFDIEEHKNNSGVKKFLYDTKEEILMHLWRYPSLSIHGIEGAFHEPGIKTVIPARVIGKFSIRQVPHMDISIGEHQVIKYLEDVFSKRNSPNKLKVSVPIRAMPWVANINDPLYTAATKAIKTVFGQDPEMIRDGSTIPIAQTFQNITRKSVMMLPVGAADDAEHSQKEKISRHNYIQGTKLFATLFLEIAKLPGKLQETSNTTTTN